MRWQSWHQLSGWHIENDGRKINIRELTIERQCENEFIRESAGEVARSDAVLSLACGAGVQAMAKRFEDIPVLPGVNTTFIGIQESEGIFTEECSGCGNCELATFGGICPVTRCAKRLFNGPCGGSQDGKCEIDPGYRLRLEPYNRKTLKTRPDG